MSRPVTAKDIPNLIKIQKEWMEICNAPAGRYPKGHAIAHVQVEAEDPVRAFITAFGEIVINPEIVETSGKNLKHKEGCMTWPFRGIKKVTRKPKVKVRYKSLLLGEKEPKDEEKWMENMDAYVFQHEIDHFNLKTLY